MRIIKRDGGYQELLVTKIQRALLMAFQGARTVPDIMPLVHRVMDRLALLDGDVSVERISDVVEGVLVAGGWVDVARAYMRYRLERTALRAERLRPSPDGLSAYVHVAKYARYMDGRRELFAETVERGENMHISRWPHLAGEISGAYSFVYDKRGMPSMRSMQFGGKAILRDNARIYNCSFGHISRWRAFSEMFYLLLCGCGVGYSVQWRHVDCLSEVGRVDASNVCHYTISDSIQGWADALEALLEAYWGLGCYMEFDYSRIRREGAVLVTSGGRAPGHLPLKKCLEAVRGVLDGAMGRRLRPIEAHDIMCHMAVAVLAGGIRRSAMIALFSPEDTEMLYAKARGVFRPSGGGGDLGVNSQREMANNSACLLRGTADRNVFERIIRVAQENYGDPGFYFTNNLDYGPNPCGEIGMWPMIWFCEECGEYGNPGIAACICGSTIGTIQSGISFCNLTEVNCAAAKDPEELVAAVKAMSTIGTLQAAYTEFPYLGPVTEAIVRREALLGVGMTGIMDNAELVLDDSLLERCAGVAVAENVRIAGLLGINAAARVTTIKPSGTAALELGGVGSGIHPRWARRYFHRVTAGPGEAAACYFRKINPHMIEEKPNGDWAIVFPIQSSDGAVTVKELDALTFLSHVFQVYKHWVLPGTARPNSSPGLTHNVSCTVTVRNEELDAVIATVWKERERVAAMTFVPSLIDRKFAFAPRQAVETERDEARWNELIRLFKPVNWLLFVEDEDNTNLSGEAACAGGICEV